MVTPDEGTLVAKGQFHDYISGLSEASIRHLEGLSAPPPKTMTNTTTKTP